MTPGSGAPGERAGLGWEVCLVLGVSLGASGVRSVLRIIERLTRGQALAEQTSALNTSFAPDRPWLDLAYQLTNVALGVVPVLLVAYLLWARPGPAPWGVGGAGAGGDPGAWRRLGFDRTRPASDLLRGLVVAAAIGVPGLGFYLAARGLGLNTTVAAANLAEHWWTTGVYVLSAAMNGVLEEVIMLGYVFWRLRQIGWAWWAVVLTSAVVRGSYHLYQGFGGFAGNVIMGVVFGALFWRWRRSAPLVVAHTLIDVAAFVGYAALVGRVGWL